MNLGNREVDIEHVFLLACAPFQTGMESGVNCGGSLRLPRMGRIPTGHRSLTRVRFLTYASC